MDPVLIMDDIIEKLNLLDYLKNFCKKKKKKPFSRTYFAIKSDSEKTEEKVRNMVEVCYWLMNLGFEMDTKSKTQARNSKSRSTSATRPQVNVDYDKFKSKEEAVERLV